MQKLDGLAAYHWALDRYRHSLNLMLFRDPEALFHAAVAALAREDWLRVAEMCDPASLSLYQSAVLRYYLEPQSHAPVTVEQYLAHAPDMPREVAEYHVRQIHAEIDRSKSLERDYPTVGSIDELRQMSAVALYASWLEGRSLRRQLQQIAKQQSLPDSAVDEALRAAGAEERATLLGVVPDGERVAHVLYRTEIAQVPAISEDGAEEREFQADMAGRQFVSVLTCRRGKDGGWRLIADHSLLGHGANVVSLR